MNRALIRFTFGEKTRSGLHLTALAIGMLTLALPAALSWQDRADLLAASWQSSYLILAQVLALLLGAGLIGRDLANGALIGWVARPMRRSTVYLSRYAGTVLALGAYLFVAATPLIPISAGTISWRRLLGAWVVAVLNGAGILAALGLLSLGLKTYQDVAALLVFGAASSFLRGGLRHSGHVRAAQLIHDLRLLLVPDGSFAHGLLLGGPLDVASLSLYALGMVTLPALGAWVLTRKRLLARVP